MARSIPAAAAWIAQVFGSQSANNGGVVRRSVADVKQFGGGLKRLKDEVRQRGFHLIRTGDQYVILCHKGDVRVIC